MDGNTTQQAFKELLPYLEALDTQSAAILHLLKDKGLTTDEQFAPYLEQAGNVSNVKWLATRLRIDHLLSSADKDKEADVRPEKKEENKGMAGSGDQSNGKSARESRDTETTEPKQGGGKTDEAKNENTENAPAPNTKQADNESEEDSNQRRKEGPNANANRACERNAEKKAS
jgi:hypothetical protein